MGGAAPGGGSSSVEWMCVHACVCAHVLALWDKMWFFSFVGKWNVPEAIKEIQIQDIRTVYNVAWAESDSTAILGIFRHIRSQTGHIFGNYTICYAITTSTCEFPPILPLIIYMLLAQIPGSKWNVWLIIFYYPPSNPQKGGECKARRLGNQSPAQAAGWELEINVVLDAAAQLHRS